MFALLRFFTHTRRSLTFSWLHRGHFPDRLWRLPHLRRYFKEWDMAQFFTTAYFSEGVVYSLPMIALGFYSSPRRNGDHPAPRPHQRRPWRTLRASVLISMESGCWPAGSLYASGEWRHRFVNFSLTFSSAFLLMKTSAKSPCRRVNEGSSPLQPLIIARKISDGTPSPPPAPRLFQAACVVNSRVRNIFKRTFARPSKGENSGIKFYLMGGHRRGKSVSFQWYIGIISCHIEGAALSFCARINGSLSIMVSGNNSGALLLTLFG